MEDKCTLDKFNSSCVNCPEITCQFTKYEKSGGWFGSWMSWYNIFGFFWAMEFVTAFGEMVMAGKLFYLAYVFIVLIILSIYLFIIKAFLQNGTGLSTRRMFQYLP